jgi:hypothetical protein
VVTQAHSLSCRGWPRERGTYDEKTDVPEGAPDFGSPRDRSALGLGALKRDCARFID